MNPNHKQSNGHFRGLARFLSASLSSEEAEQYVQLLKEYWGKFAWSYADMPGLDPEIAVHRLNIKPDAKPIKQAQRRFHPLLMKKIEKEVQKWKDVGFIREEKDPDWLANIASVTKKNGRIRVWLQRPE